MKLHPVLISVAIAIAVSGCATNRSSEQSFETGKLMIDFVGPLKKQMIKRKLLRLAKEEAEDAAEVAAKAKAK